jgi:hypothetical protein
MIPLLVRVIRAGWSRVSGRIQGVGHLRLQNLLKRSALAFKHVSHASVQRY